MSLYQRTPVFFFFALDQNASIFFFGLTSTQKVGEGGRAVVEEEEAPVDGESRSRSENASIFFFVALLVQKGGGGGAEVEEEEAPVDGENRSIRTPVFFFFALLVQKYQYSRSLYVLLY